MKRLLIILFLLLLVGIFIPASVPAESGPFNQGEVPRLQVAINQFKKQGYKLVGLSQYLKKGSDKIYFLKYQPVSYEELKVMDEAGAAAFLNKYDFVYILKRNKDVVLIRLNKTGGPL